jgi:hypothetical protein
MKSLKSAQSILLVLLVAACGDTVDLGGPPDSGGAGSQSTTSTTSGSGTATNTGTGGAGTTTNTGTGGAGTTTNTGVGGGPDPTTGGTGGTRTTVGAGGSGGANTGTGGSPGTGGAGGGTVCGGLLGAECPSGTFCDYPPNAMCGAADQTGVCSPIPTGACPADCPGVCGCDGRFYCSVCVAHMAGVDDSTDVSCLRDGGPQVCGGLRGGECDAKSYCHYTPAAQCGAADATGVCQPRPQVCPQDCPGVCGCDGKFYCNSCMAQSAGVDVSPNTTCSRDR